MYATFDTIVAIASAPGPAARGIVRASGPDALTVLAKIFSPDDGAPLSTPLKPHAVRGTLRLDNFPGLTAEVLVWPTARSYTRQPLVEIHLLGSPPLVAAVLAAMCRHGARLAQPGEFTLRAFLAGRMDLAQAEAVLGVIDARDADDLQAALAQLAGGLSRPLAALREALVELLAHLEAGLDFVEEDIRFISCEEIQRQLDDAAAIVTRIDEQLTGRDRRDALSRVVLTGCPNVGKSSLYNALADGTQALVANEPGTTRDYLVTAIDLEGIGCLLCDTAGIEVEIAAGETISDQAQQLGARQQRHCDVQLLCLDATRPLNAWERQALTANRAMPRLVLLTKCDAGVDVRWKRDELASAAFGEAVLETSAKSGHGLSTLRQALRMALSDNQRGEDASLLTADRCRESLKGAADALGRAAELNRSAAGEELIGAELRGALDELGAVLGVVYTEDILGRIFSRFCIGK